LNSIYENLPIVNLKKVNSLFNRHFFLMEFFKSVFKTVGLAEVGSGKGFTVRELLREVLRF